MSAALEEAATILGRMYEIVCEIQRLSGSSTVADSAVLDGCKRLKELHEQLLSYLLMAQVAERTLE